MFSSSRRLVGRGGANAVCLGLTGGAHIAAYRFNRVTGWGSPYAGPTTSTGISSTSTSVAFGRSNTKVLLTGLNNTGLRLYDWSQNSGFGSQQTVLAANPWSAMMSRSGNKMLLSFPAGVSEYNYSDGGVGSLIFTHTAAQSFQRSAYIYDDRYIISSFTSSVSFRIYSPGSATVIDSRPHFGTPFEFSMSPVAFPFGNRMLAIPNSSGLLRLYWIAASGLVATEVVSNVGSGVSAAIFDSYGRLIIGRNANQIGVYAVNPATGAQTLIQEISNSTPIPFTGSAVNSLTYDVDSDILFVGATTSPHVVAYRMGGGGFVSKYSDPAIPVGVGVGLIALQYADAWKKTNN